MVNIAWAQSQAQERYQWFSRQGKALDHPVGGLADAELDELVIGRSFFTIPWVSAPSSTTARDGLGPLFNASACASCHRGNGRGEKYNAYHQPGRALITKLSMGVNVRGQQKPVPLYGGQIAIRGSSGVLFEATPTLQEIDVPVKYGDGSAVVLKKPRYGLKNLHYGPLPQGVNIVQRLAPPLTGLGLLSRVSDTDILTHADVNDSDGDGISGKPNYVFDLHGVKRLGRFTWKASVATALEQTAIAAANDMGLSNPFFVHELCSKGQTACLKAAKGGADAFGNTLDLPMRRLTAIAQFITKTRVPITRTDASGRAGKKLFAQIGCSGCHLPTLKTRGGIVFHPYTDLLVHDMGDGLADGRTEFQASGREFRTAPLWALTAAEKTLLSGRPYYLHDGRAATVEQAILWHGGEAESAKARFMSLSAQKRQQIIAFLKQL